MPTFGYEMAGAAKASTSGINGAGPETDKQLVHQSKKEELA